MLHNRGDVVLIPFPFSENFSLAKKRPALVLSSPQNDSDELTVAMITSVYRDKDTKVQEWQAAGLLYPSYIRTKMVTIDPILILQTIGTLRKDDLHGFQDVLKSYLGLEEA